MIECSFWPFGVGQWKSNYYLGALIGSHVCYWYCWNTDLDADIVVVAVVDIGVVVVVDVGVVDSENGMMIAYYCSSQDVEEAWEELLENHVADAAAAADGADSCCCWTPWSRRRLVEERRD